MTEDTLQRPGDVNIERLQLISTRNLAVDLDDYLVEFNLYEDMFSQGLSGSILISDHRNLVSTMPIVGEELLVVKFTTPTFPTSIEKTFRVTSVTDKQIVSGQTAHRYILHFISHELSLDMNAPLFKSFDGVIHDVVAEIFTDYVSLDAPLKILAETKNKVKFVSPGWSAFKCINWLASKSIPAEGKACNFLFWESNKSFYFTNLETLFQTKRYTGVYTYAPNNVRINNDRDIAREMFLTESVEIVTSIDHVKNYTNGYLSNRLIELDLMNKKYEFIDYDHTEKYSEYKHMSDSAMPFFAESTLRNPLSNVRFYPKHNKLFNDFEENINEVYKDIHGNRLSNMLELDNFKLNLVVPGRTDVEVGQMIYLLYPNISPRDQSDKVKDNLDPMYTGAYLITGIRHQITGIKHKMIMEVTKDCLSGNIDI